MANSLENAVVSPKKATTSEISKLQAAVLSSEVTSISVGIDKNAIIDEYTQACLSKEGIPRQVTSSNKGEPTNKPTTYPTIAQLVRDCQMKPSLNHQYRVDDLVLGVVHAWVGQKLLNCFIFKSFLLAVITS